MINRYNSVTEVRVPYTGQVLIFMLNSTVSTVELIYLQW